MFLIFSQYYVQNFQTWRLLNVCWCGKFSTSPSNIAFSFHGKNSVREFSCKCWMIILNPSWIFFCPPSYFYEKYSFEMLEAWRRHLVQHLFSHHPHARSKKKVDFHWNEGRRKRISNVTGIKDKSWCVCFVTFIPGADSIAKEVSDS